MIPMAITFAIGAGAGVGGTYAYFSRSQTSSTAVTTAPQQQQSQAVRVADKPAPAPADVQYSPALKYGIPISDYLRFFTDYVSSFDSRTRNPRWVIEHITKDSISGEGNRKKSEFFEDKFIEERFRSKLSDYRRSGYDRGHLAPASNHKSSQQAMDDTFTMSNMSPQVGEGFNRDYWARFEEFTRGLTKQADEVFIITGPLFLPTWGPNNRWQMRYDMIGQAPQLVAVPTHFYKVVLTESKGKPASVGAFVMPNSPVDPSIPLTSFVVPLRDLESVAGTKFFPYFLTEDRRKAVDAVASQLSTASQRMLPPANANLLPAPIVAAQSTALTAAAAAADGTKHLCQAVACKLPSERFWESAQNATKK